MDSERLQHLIDEYQQETYTDEEYQELINWFHSLNYTNLDFRQWMEEVGGSDQMAAAMLEEFKSKYLPMAVDEEDQYSEPVRIKVNWWMRISEAVAVVAVISLGVWLYYTPRHSGEGRNPGSAQYATDIAPGKNTATLTLAGGKVINLDTNKTSVTVADSVKTSTMLTASTPRGGTYEVVLPDGTHVWLNAASSIKFPSAFTGKDRTVELTGEAYFEVATTYMPTSTSSSNTSSSSSPATSPSLRGRRTKQSFIVKTADQEVTVLGTHFNINSYEQTVRTTLVEGSVQVTPLQQPDKKTIIKPGQQAVVSKNLLEVLPVDVDVATAWKNGNFLFRNERLESIMKRLAYWYDVEVIYLYDKRDLKYTGVIGRKRNLSSILNLLEVAGNVKFKIEGRKVYVFD